MLSALNRGLQIFARQMPTALSALPEVANRSFSQCTPSILSSRLTPTPKIGHLSPLLIQSRTLVEPIVIKFSKDKGEWQSVQDVTERFFRLHWGGWIRTRTGRNLRLWRKKANNRMRLEHHVLCNATQSRLLDKMTTNYYKKRRYYVDDPYEPYHTREEYPITSRKPIDRDFKDL